MSDRRERLQQQCLTGRVEVDAAADDDVVGTAVGSDEASGGIVLLGDDLAGRAVAGAATELQPRPVVQDRDVARLKLDRTVDAVGGQPGPAAHHRDELQRVLHDGTRHPRAPHREPAGQESADLNEVEHLGQLIDHVRTIAQEMRTHNYSEYGRLAAV
ncbi:hypothetical protein MOQ72_18890 [Saccharopolyspora sp. K220]|nr:hypothetical protein [Saccharopolyspora soli]MCI2419514.1 hypothetical protein [Saccharopolyspora soli]